MLTDRKYPKRAPFKFGHPPAAVLTRTASAQRSPSILETSQLAPSIPRTRTLERRSQWAQPWTSWEQGEAFLARDRHCAVPQPTASQAAHAIAVQDKFQGHKHLHTYRLEVEEGVSHPQGPTDANRRWMQSRCRKSQSTGLVMISAISSAHAVHLVGTAAPNVSLRFIISASGTALLLSVDSPTPLARVHLLTLTRSPAPLFVHYGTHVTDNSTSAPADN